MGATSSLFASLEWAVMSSFGSFGETNEATDPADPYRSFQTKPTRDSDLLAEHQFPTFSLANDRVNPLSLSLSPTDHGGAYQLGLFSR